MPIIVEKDHVELKLPSASVGIHLFGATLTSWKVNGSERIFLSAKALLDGSRGIRGGIPLVFPQFATSQPPHPTSALPQHGVARVSYWKYVSEIEDTNDKITVLFELTEAEVRDDLRSKWNHQFKLSYVVSLTADSLRTELKIFNPSSTDSFEFQTLLHTYFRVPDCRRVRVEGLEGTPFIDKTKGGETSTLNGPFSGVTKEVDYVFENSKDHLLLDYQHPQLSPLSITKENFLDTVVWNPWVEKAKAITDFVAEEYAEMICVEVGSVRKFIQLLPQASWTASQTLRVV